MDRKLKHEIVFVTAVGAILTYLMGHRKSASVIGALSTSIAFFPTRPVSFRNRVVLITGGSRGLGLALATEFARQGALIAILARDENELAKAQVRLSALTETLALKCDVTQETELKSAIEKILQHFGALDVVVNNAGAIMVGPHQSARREDYQAQLDLHFFAPMQVMNLCLPYLKKSAIGRVINICSMGGKVAMPHMLAYDTSKFALAGFSQGMTYELAKDNIPVTTVYPALMQTGSPIQAVFKGDHEKEFAWFAISDLLPGLSWPAARAAREIVLAASLGQREVILSALAKVRMFTASLLPEMMGAIFSSLNRFLPSGQSLEYKTGAQSRGLMDAQPALKPLRDRAQAIEKLWNQESKTDAEFNLGLH